MKLQRSIRTRNDISRVRREASGAMAHRRTLKAVKGQAGGKSTCNHEAIHLSVDPQVTDHSVVAKDPQDPLEVGDPMATEDRPGRREEDLLDLTVVVEADLLDPMVVVEVDLQDLTEVAVDPQGEDRPEVGLSDHTVVVEVDPQGEDLQGEDQVGVLDPTGTTRGTLESPDKDHRIDLPWVDTRVDYLAHTLFEKQVQWTSVAVVDGTQEQGEPTMASCLSQPHPSLTAATSPSRAF